MEVLTTAYHEMCAEFKQLGRDFLHLATLQEGKFHHDVAARVFQAANSGLQLVKSVDYGRLHERTGTFVVYGKLNIQNFSPYMARAGKWALAECNTVLEHAGLS